MFLSTTSKASPFKDYSGLIHVPSAYVIGHKVLEFTGSVDAYQDVYKNVKQDIDVRVSLGIERIELGFVFLTDKLYSGSFKLTFIDENEEGWLPAVAWGIRAINGDARITSTGTDSPYTSDQNNALFIVGTKKLNLETTTVTINLGIGSAGFKAETPILKNLEGLFFGFDLPLTFLNTSFHNVSILTEFDGKHINMGIRWNHKIFTLGFTASSIDRLRTENVTYGEAEGFRIGMGLTVSSKSLGLW